MGYTEGRDYLIVHRAADGHLNRLAGDTGQLVRLKVDVIATATDEATRAARKATSTIPIVAIQYNHDPVASGLIDSFNRPGGNVTGLTVRNTEIAAKRLELLKDTIPGLSRVAVFSDSFGRGELDVLKPAARMLGVQLRIVEVRSPDEFASAFKSAKTLGLTIPAAIRMRADEVIR
jgi:putative ABC transport system substrate-binding protein